MRRQLGIFIIFAALLFLTQPACTNTPLYSASSTTSSVTASSGCTVTQQYPSLTLNGSVTSSDSYSVTFSTDEGVPAVSGTGGFTPTTPQSTSNGVYAFQGTFSSSGADLVTVISPNGDESCSITTTVAASGSGLTASSNGSVTGGSAPSCTLTAGSASQTAGQPVNFTLSVSNGTPESPTGTGGFVLNSALSGPSTMGIYTFSATFNSTIYTTETASVNVVVDGTNGGQQECSATVQINASSNNIPVTCSLTPNPSSVNINENSSGIPTSVSDQVTFTLSTNTIAIVENMAVSGNFVGNGIYVGMSVAAGGLTFTGTFGASGPQVVTVFLGNPQNPDVAYTPCIANVTVNAVEAPPPPPSTPSPTCTITEDKTSVAKGGKQTIMLYCTNATSGLVTHNTNNNHLIQCCNCGYSWNPTVVGEQELFGQVWGPGGSGSCENQFMVR